MHLEIEHPLVSDGDACAIRRHAGNFAGRTQRGPRVFVEGSEQGQICGRKAGTEATISHWAMAFHQGT